MKTDRFAVVLALSALGVCGGALLSLNAHASGRNDASSLLSRRIQHVVIILQENRTPDNLFHDSVLMSRGADIASFGLTSTGVVPLVQGDLATDYDLNHSHPAFEKTYDKGKMDGANLISATCNKGAVDCPPPYPQYVYVNPTEVQPYFQLAEQYTFGDRMFQTHQGPSFPAHQFIISGTSAPTATSDLFASSNVSPGNGAVGCLAPPGNVVHLIDPSGNESQTQYPCFEHPTLTDLLDAKGISWRYYTPSAGSLWTGPNAIQHICQPETKNSKLVCTGSAWSNVIIPQTKVLTDIANNRLAQVTWVIPDGQESDHAGVNDGSGPSWVASIVNAIGNSPYWDSTAIFITWDDWGGWYDHVSPPKVLVDCAEWGCGYVYGFRVPLIVVSPYAKTRYISHVDHDFGSILKFIEEAFDLPSLGYADAYAFDDLSDCFDFYRPPTAFQKIMAPASAEDFLNDQRPPLDPDDD
jgi:phospholipase C